MSVEAKESVGRYDWAEDPTAQDVVDALRVAVGSAKQDDPGAVLRMVEEMLAWAPETFSSRGFDLLARMVSDGVLKLVFVEKPR